MRLRSGSAAMEGVEAMRSPNNPRHAELVSASIVPPTQMSGFQADSAVCSFDLSAQTEGWILKQVQDDGDFEVFG